MFALAASATVMEDADGAIGEMEQPLYPNVLCIGHHDEHRQQSAPAEELDHAQDLAVSTASQ